MCFTVQPALNDLPPSRLVVRYLLRRFRIPPRLIRYMNTRSTMSLRAGSRNPQFLRTAKAGQSSFVVVQTHGAVGQPPNLAEHEGDRRYSVYSVATGKVRPSLSNEIACDFGYADHIAYRTG